MNYWSDVAEAPWRFDLLAVLRRLEREATGKPRIGAALQLADEVVALAQPPYLGFPAANVSAFAPSPNGAPRLETRFLGLFGPQGALPLETTEEAWRWDRSGDPAFAHFADILQRRFLSFFYRAWADAHPIAQNDRPAEDRFKVYLGALIGLASPALRNMDSLPEAAKLSFAGLLSQRVKSATRLKALLAGLFDVKLEIEEFAGDWLPIEPTERSRLGAANSALGRDLIVGSRMFSVSDKFRIRIYTRDLPHYRSFLPGTPRAEEIADAIYLYLGFEFEWDLELAIPSGKVQAARLGGRERPDEGARLGWTTWMSPTWASTDRTWRMDAKFDVAGRLAAQRARKRG